jgi:Skp family chaperone for outer membrane proteins
MPKLFPTLLTAALLSAGIAAAADEIVFIDLQETFKRFYKTQLAQDQIRQQAEDIKLERDLMEEEIKVMKEEIDVLRADSRDQALSEDVRISKRNQLEEKLVDLQKKETEMTDFEKLRKEQIEQQNSRMSRKLFDEIQEAIIDFSKEKGYRSVIDRSAVGRNGLQTVLFATPKSDITGDVLAVLNEGREPKTSEEVKPEINIEQ